jgi:hypothetical protein
MASLNHSLPPAASANGHVSARDRFKKLIDETPPIVEPETLMVDVNRVVQRAVNGEEQPRELVSVRLMRKFGGGADCRRRRELYRRLDLVVKAHGDEAIEVIGSVVADAVGKDKPGNYFCRAVIGRLRDRKLLIGLNGGDASW